MVSMPIKSLQNFPEHLIVHCNINDMLQTGDDHTFRCLSSNCQYLEDFLEYSLAMSLLVDKLHMGQNQLDQGQGSAATNIKNINITCNLKQFLQILLILNSITLQQVKQNKLQFVLDAVYHQEVLQQTLLCQFRCVRVSVKHFAAA